MLVDTARLWKLLAWHVYNACWWARVKFLISRRLFSADGKEKSNMLLLSTCPLLNHVTVGGGDPAKEAHRRLANRFLCALCRKCTKHVYNLETV